LHAGHTRRVSSKSSSERRVSQRTHCPSAPPRIARESLLDMLTPIYLVTYEQTSALSIAAEDYGGVVPSNAEAVGSAVLNGNLPHPVCHVIQVALRIGIINVDGGSCLLYTSPSPRDRTRSR